MMSVSADDATVEAAATRAFRRVLVTGGRDYDDYQTVAATLTEIGPAVVAEGGASGADRLAAIWCYETDTEHKTYPAEWAKYGRAAGPIRNEQMLREFEPDLVVAFPGGRGTAHMVGIARRAGVEILKVCAPPAGAVRVAGGGA